MLREFGGINGKDMAVYRVYDGSLQNMIMYDKDGKVKSVDTRDLSEAMSDIFREYMQLKEVKG